MACNIHVNILTDNQTECDRTFLPARYLDSLIFKEKNDVINNNNKKNHCVSSVSDELGSLL